MKTILIVDPDVSGGATADLLERHGFVPLIASEARTALSIINSGMPVDLVITELHLPDMEGVDFLNALRRRRPGLPLLVVTARGSIESYLHAVNLGVVEYLNKPVVAKELSLIVKSLFDHHRHPEASWDAA